MIGGDTLRGVDFRRLRNWVSGDGSRWQASGDVTKYDRMVVFGSRFIGVLNVFDECELQNDCSSKPDVDDDDESINLFVL